MHPTKFRFNWQSGLRGEDFIILFQTMNDDPDCHQTWPLPLLKKSVKNRKLLKKIDSSLKPFGQMNLLPSFGSIGKAV
jgi:hypothetical protein